jgi:hypothetical protein
MRPEIGVRRVDAAGRFRLVEPGQQIGIDESRRQANPADQQIGDLRALAFPAVGQHRAIERGGGVVAVLDDIEIGERKLRPCITWIDRQRVFEGPAILEQLDCTTVVEPGDKVRQDKIGNLLITVG